MGEQQQLIIAYAQMAPRQGDLSYNTEYIIREAHKAKELNAKFIVFPELALCGYWIRDLLFEKSFHKSLDSCLERIKQEVKDIAVLVGHPAYNDKKINNRVSMIYNGEISWSYNKEKLPNYGVFDEKRYFEAGKPSASKPIVFEGFRLGVNICEDIWHESCVSALKDEKLDLIININASPFSRNKEKLRRAVLQNVWKLNQTPCLYLNASGGQDHLIFDGASLLLDNTGDIKRIAPLAKEGLYSLTLKRGINNQTTVSTNYTEERSDKTSELIEILCLGLKDFVKKNGLKKVLLGVSGGIDSAVTAALAVRSLGAKNVEAILMPSPYTSSATEELSLQLCKDLNIDHQVVNIHDAYKVMYDLTIKSPESSVNQEKVSIAAQNIQARIRGLILMANANKKSSLVLATGNKSELAMGYCTLYGDMCGAIAPIGDLSKTEVYELANWFQKNEKNIPQAIIDRPPTAELAPNQLDTDSLPPYSHLDKILDSLYKDRSGYDATHVLGHREEEVTKIKKQVQKNEFKRQQAPLSLRVSKESLNYDWRYPISI